MNKKQTEGICLYLTILIYIANESGGELRAQYASTSLFIRLIFEDTCVATQELNHSHAGTAHGLSREKAIACATKRFTADAIQD